MLGQPEQIGKVCHKTAGVKEDERVILSPMFAWMVMMTVICRLFVRCAIVFFDEMEFTNHCALCVCR